METELDWYKEIYEENRLLALCYKDLCECSDLKYRNMKKRFKDQMAFKSAVMSFFSKILPADLQNNDLEDKIKFVFKKFKKLKILESEHSAANFKKESDWPLKKQPILDDLHAEIHKNKTVIDSLQTELDSLKKIKSSVDTNDSKHSKNDISAYHTQIMNLSNKLLKNQESYDSKIRELEDEKDSLKSKYELKIKDIESQLKLLQENDTRKSLALKTLETEKDSLIAQLKSEIQANINKHNTELLMLKNRVQDNNPDPLLIQQKTHLEAECKNFKNKIEQLQLEIVNINKRHEYEMQRMLEHQEKKLRDAEKKVIQDILKRKTDINIKKGMNSTQDSVAACIEHVLIIDKLQSDINKYENKIETLSAQIQANKEFYQSEYDKHFLTIRDLPEQISKLRDENAKLRAEIQYKWSETNKNRDLKENNSDLHDHKSKASDFQYKNVIQKDLNPEKMLQRGSKNSNAEIKESKGQNNQNIKIDSQGEDNQENTPKNVIIPKIPHTTTPLGLENNQKQIQISNHLNPENEPQSSQKQKINVIRNSDRIKQILDNQTNDSHHIFPTNLISKKAKNDNLFKSKTNNNVNTHGGNQLDQVKKVNSDNPSKGETNNNVNTQGVNQLDQGKKVNSDDIFKSKTNNNVNTQGGNQLDQVKKVNNDDILKGGTNNNVNINQGTSPKQTKKVKGGNLHNIIGKKNAKKIMFHGYKNEAQLSDESELKKDVNFIKLPQADKNLVSEKKENDVLEASVFGLNGHESHFNSDLTIKSENDSFLHKQISKNQQINPKPKRKAKNQVLNFGAKKKAQTKQSGNIPAFFNDLTFSESSSNTLPKRKKK